MKLLQFIAIKEWVGSWLLLARSKTYLVSSAVLDLLFLMAYGFLVGPVYDKLTTHIIIIGSLVAEQLRVPEGRARPAVIDVLFQEPVSQYTWQFFGLMVLLMVIVFALFWLVQGLNWYLASSTTGSSMSLRKYLISFGRVTAFWFVIFAAWYCIDTVLDLRRIAIEKATGQPAAATGVFWMAVLLLMSYFLFVSYPGLGIRNGIRIGISKAATLVPAALMLIAHFLAGNMIVRALSQVNTIVMFMIGALLLLVLVAWTRIYILLVVRKVSHV